MHTEEEAKKLWCPNVRYLAVFIKDGHRECTGAYNRGAGDSNIGTSLCIASSCAMWRWWSNEDIVDVVQRVNNIHPEWSAQQCYDSIKHQGYCGLAGKP